MHQEEIAPESKNNRKLLIWFLIGLLVAIIPWLVVAAN